MLCLLLLSKIVSGTGNSKSDFTADVEVRVTQSSKD